MNAKTIIQLLIFFLIIIFIYFFIKNTFLKEQKNIVNLDQNEAKNTEEIKIEKDETNIIENLNYISIDAEGNLINPGKILYTSEQPRIDQTTFNFNYGISMSLQVPLGR